MIILQSLSDPQLAELLKKGEVGVILTDTIYGLATISHSKDAVNRLYALKHRDHKPGTLIAANIDQLRQLGLADEHIRAVAHLWPNPISIVLPAPDELGYLHQDVGSLAVRIPDDAILTALLEKTGPLITSSANPPGAEPAHNIHEAQSYFGDTVALYVDGGDVRDRSPSTVLRLEPDGNLTVLRQGAIKISGGEIVDDI